MPEVGTLKWHSMSLKNLPWAVLCLAALTMLPQSALSYPGRLRHLSEVLVKLDCDSDALAICLQHADSNFRDCEKGCEDEFMPNDPPGFSECRDGCRGIREDNVKTCYEENCQTSSLTKKRMCAAIPDFQTAKARGFISGPAQ
jgi:hypothetical protein